MIELLKKLMIAHQLLATGRLDEAASIWKGSTARTPTISISTTTWASVIFHQSGPGRRSHESGGSQEPGCDLRPGGDTLQATTCTAPMRPIPGIRRSYTVSPSPLWSSATLGRSRSTSRWCWICRLKRSSPLPRMGCERSPSAP